MFRFLEFNKKKKRISNGCKNTVVGNSYLKIDWDHKGHQCEIICCVIIINPERRNQNKLVIQT